MPQHAEKILPAVSAAQKTEFTRVLEKRLEDLLGAQVTRVKKVIQTASNIL